jgi:leucyl/phenylalanyl-tRNA--protein transferase
LNVHTDRLTFSATVAPSDGRRAALFRESAADRLERWALGLAWSLSPKRAAGIPNLARMCFDEFLAPNYALPDPELAQIKPEGLAGIVHEFTPSTVLAAYRRGLYPHAHIAPLKWWSPPQRSVLFFAETHLAKRLRRQMRQGQYTVTFDRDFEGVIAACAGRRSGRWHLTWITPKIMRTYAALFDAGHAHSFEVWNAKDELVGGGYGVSTGGAFSTESQFSREANTSKIGFAVLNWHLAKWGYAFNDGKLMTPTCQDLGFREIARSDYLTRLAEAERRPGRSGRWQVEAGATAVADWQPA